VLILRGLVLLGVLVGGGLATVWWRTQTLTLGYEAARLECEITRKMEEQRVEESRLARLTTPAQVASAVRNLNLELDSRAAKTVLLPPRAIGPRVLVLAGPGQRRGAER
jgi:hypothetical protein